ncbi:glycosyltransferase family 2 protein [Pseudomonadota bacterium]
MPKISLIVPVFNRENYLRQCLDSAIKQSFSDIEIICINDGSTDGSLDILESFAKRDARIKILTQENQGLGAARNTGILASEGDYLAFLDADDFIHHDMLHTMITDAISQNSKIVVCGFNETDKQGNTTSSNNSHVESADREVILQRALALQTSSMICNKLIKKSLFTKNDILFPVGVFHEDVLINYQLMFYASHITNIDQYFYNWRRTEGSISKSISQKHITDIFLMLEHTKSFLMSKGIYERDFAHYLRRYIIFCSDLIYRVESSALSVNVKAQLVAMIALQIRKDGVMTRRSCSLIRNKDFVLYAKCRIYFKHYTMRYEQQDYVSNKQTGDLEKMLQSRYGTNWHKFRLSSVRLLKRLLPNGSGRSRLIHKFIKKVFH